MSTVNSVAIDIVGKVDPAVRKRVAADPFTALRYHFDLDIIEIDDPRRRGDGGTCDGFSFLDADAIYYRPTWSDRQYFTVAHELAHFLVERDDDAIDWLTDQPDTAGLLEKVCDATASRLLIPDELIRAIGSPPTARSLAVLSDSTNASRSACAVRLAERLPCDGFVVLVEPQEQRVFFASRHDDTRPYAWQGNLVPDGHHLRSVDVDQERKVESWWPFPSGERVPFYLSSYRDRDWVYAIFAEHDLWHVTNFHAHEQRQRDDRPELRLACPDCRFSGSFRGYPCTECRKPYCPRCSRCDCDRRAERSNVCKVCHYVKASHLIDEDGVCVDCR